MYRIAFIILASVVLFMGIQDDGRNVRVHVSGTSPVTCDADSRGDLFNLEPGSGTKDALKVCLKSDADAYSWVEIANGGA